MAHIEGLTEDLRQQVAALQQRVAASQWDLEAWKKMAELAHSLRAARRIPEAHLQLQRTIYEDLLMQFPTWVRYWKEYAEGEMEAGQEGRVKAIVSRCLLPCKAADLWQVYLRFVQQMNEPKMPEGMVEVSRAYQYTLEYIGQDFHSGLIWQEYLDFLQAPRPGTPAYLALYGAAAKEQQEGHRAVLIRKAYQQALMVPTAQLDAIWRAYEAFENSTSNKVFADKVLSEQHHHYQGARGLVRKRQELLRPLMRDGPAMLPGVELMKAWRTYLEWEVGNPQKLQDQDLLNQRIALAYDQALMELQHYPEMWHEYCRWYQSSMKDWQRGVEAILHRAQKACPGCLMFHFMEADIAEAQNNLEAAKQLYNALVAPMDADASKEPGSQAVDVPEEQGGLLWVQFMRFTLRTAGLTQARKVFVRAKKWRKCPWQVYCMAAMMEWYQPSCSDPSVPRRIFERGMEKPGFLAQVGFVSAYVNFLIGCRDTVNARAVLERVLAEEKARQERGIWDLFLQFEREHGSLQAMVAVQERMRAAFPDDFDEGDELQMAITSYQYQEMWPCTMRQQQHLEHVLRSAGDGEPEADGHELHSDAASAGAAAGVRVAASWEGTLPPALAALLVQLSPASQVVGPVPGADLVMEAVKGADFVALAQRWPGLELSEAALGQKRRMDSQGLDDDLASLGGSGAATQYDVFRRRRRQKARLM